MNFWLVKGQSFSKERPSKAEKVSTIIMSSSCHFHTNVAKQNFAKTGSSGYRWVDTRDPAVAGSHPGTNCIIFDIYLLQNCISALKNK